MPHTARGSNEEAVYSFRVPRVQLEALRKIAHAEHRSLAQYFLVMIEREIAATEDAAAAA